jgi:DNA polymerase III epsilon subunit-like protein
VLADPALLVIDVQTAGLGQQAWAVQIAVLDGTGRTVVNEMLNPCEPITAAASELHGIAPSHVARPPPLPFPWPRQWGSGLRARYDLVPSST